MTATNEVLTQTRERQYLSSREKSLADVETNRAGNVDKGPFCAHMQPGTQHCKRKGNIVLVVLRDVVHRPIGVHLCVTTDHVTTGGWGMRC